jgi:hypothetical protein
MVFFFLWCVLLIILNSLKKTLFYRYWFHCIFNKHLGLYLRKKNLTFATSVDYTGRRGVTIILLYLVLTINLLTEKKIF